MRRLILPLGIGALFFLGGWGAACSSGKGTGGTGGDQGIPALADVVYEGGVTDEALDALLKATPTQSATLAANFTFPTNNAMVPSSPVPKFTWAIGAKATEREPARFVDPIGSAIGSAIGSTRETVGTRSLFDRGANTLVKGLLSGVREAHAHGTPTSGTAFFVLFTTPKNDKLLRVFTPNLDYTPDATALGKLTSAGEAIHAIITNADFDQNRIAQDGGPYQGSEIVFTMQ